MRRINWLGELISLAQRLDGAAFRWGHTDCAMLCIEAVDAVSGSSHAVAHRGQYASRRASLRYQRRVGDLAEGLRRAGLFLLELRSAAAGDILTHPHPDLPWVVGHVCFGRFSLTAREDVGVCWVHTAAVQGMEGARAWRIA